MLVSHLRLGDSLPAVLSKRPLSAAVKETLPLTNVSYVLKSQMKGKREGECGRKRRETSRFIFLCVSVDAKTRWDTKEAITAYHLLNSLVPEN